MGQNRIFRTDEVIQFGTCNEVGKCQYK